MTNTDLAAILVPVIEAGIKALNAQAQPGVEASDPLWTLRALLDRVTALEAENARLRAACGAMQSEVRRVNGLLDALESEE